MGSSAGACDQHACSGRASAVGICPCEGLDSTRQLSDSNKTRDYPSSNAKPRSPRSVLILSSDPTARPHTQKERSGGVRCNRLLPVQSPISSEAPLKLLCCTKLMARARPRVRPLISLLEPPLIATVKRTRFFLSY